MIESPSTDLPLPFVSIPYRVPFHDIDPMEVVWHGRYVKYLELARCTLLDSIDYDYPQMKASGYAWPIVDISLRYISPARYNTVIHIEARICEWDPRLIMRYRIFHKDSGKKLARARTVQVPIFIETGKMYFESPEILMQSIARWQAHYVKVQA